MKESLFGFETQAFFVFRTPLLSIDEYLAWSGELCSSDVEYDSTDALDASIAEDSERLRRRLREIFCRAEVREALYIASPRLEARLDDWLANPMSRSGQKLEPALVRYFVRMCTRATPFGLFAGVSQGKSGPAVMATHLPVADTSSVQRSTRLDWGYLNSLFSSLLRDPKIRDCINWVLSPTLYSVGGEYRYVECDDTNRAKGRLYKLVSVEATKYLEFVVRNTCRPQRRSAIANALSEAFPDLADSEVRNYLADLIQSGILVPSEGPTLTGDDALAWIIKQPDRVDVLTSVANSLLEARAQMRTMDERMGPSSPDEYRALVSVLPNGHEHARKESSHCVRVDFFRRAPEASLGWNVIREVAKCMEILSRACQTPQRELAEFSAAFSRRFDAREVPLLEATDPDLGIVFGASQGVESDDRLLNLIAEESQLQQAMLDLVVEAAGAARREVALTPGFLKRLPAARSGMTPRGLTASCQLRARSEEAVVRGEFQIFLRSALGPSAVKLLGRFLDLDANLRADSELLLRKEETCAPLHAEVVFLPDDRIANILVRPILREFEIPIAGYSGISNDRQISLRDLTISSRAGRLVLRSRSLGREIVPHLTNAHNFLSVHSIPLYGLLCSLSSQDRSSSLQWSWGKLGRLPFLPRVSFGRCVLALAQWTISADEVKQILGCTRRSHRRRLLRSLRSDRMIPRSVVVSNSDQELLVDLENELSIEALVSILSSSNGIVLKESFLGAAGQVARGSTGSYVSELNIPFLETSSGRTSGASFASCVADVLPAHRRYLPTSEWLYLKLYVGNGAADRVLKSCIPAIREAFRSGSISQWFFLRYRDPDCHIRLRLQGFKETPLLSCLSTIVTAITPYKDSGLLPRLQIDTYEREVERYGGIRGVELAETLFWILSEITIAAIELPCWCYADRVVLASATIVLVLEAFGFSRDSQIGLLSGARQSREEDCKDVRSMRKAVDTRFRHDRTSLVQLLQFPAKAIFGDAQDCSGWLRALRETSEKVISESASGGLGVSLESYVVSIIHMQADRVFPSDSLFMEYMAYALLERTLKSDRAMRSA